jgi:hypothetical protein
VATTHVARTAIGSGIAVREREKFNVFNGPKQKHQPFSWGVSDDTLQGGTRPSDGNPIIPLLVVI